jgi:hypothetical protein
MDNLQAAEKLMNQAAMISALSELLSVEEKVVAEQSGRILEDEAALKRSNERFLAFIREAAMRLKNPMEVVEGNIVTVIEGIEEGHFDNRDVSLQLKLQVKNLEQIRQNIIELNKVIVSHSEELSDASRKFLME